MTKDFETWYEDNKIWLGLDEINPNQQHLLYEGDELLGINPIWILEKIGTHNYLPIYRMYIKHAKNDPEHADVELLQKYRHKLYEFCMETIKEYCLDI